MLYYIFCEGLQTEPLYFQGIKRLIEENPIYREMVLIEIEPCGAETLRVIHQAERYVKENQISKGYSAAAGPDLPSVRAVQTDTTPRQPRMP